MHRDQFSLDDGGSATSLSPSSNARELALPPSIGFLAVRIVGRFKRPKVKVLAQGKGGVSPAPDSHRPGED